MTEKPRRGYCHWTDEEEMELLYLLQTQSVEKVAQKLHRSERSIKARFYAIKGHPWQVKRKTLAHAYSVETLSDAMGISQTTVKVWIKRKWLEANKTGLSMKRQDWVIQEAHVYRFIQERVRILAIPAIQDLRLKDYAEKCFRQSDAREWLSPRQAANLKSSTVFALEKVSARGLIRKRKVPGFKAAIEYYRADVMRWKPSPEKAQEIRAWKKAARLRKAA